MQKRIVTSILLSVLVILITVGVVSHLSVRDSIDRSVSHHLSLARLISNHMDSLLESNLNRLYDVSLSGAINFGDDNWDPERRALERAYEYSLFSDGIVLLDLQGNIRLAYPPGRYEGNLYHLPQVREALESRRATVSDVYTEANNRKLIYVFVPVKDRFGTLAGLIGGEINPTNPTLNRIMKAVPFANDTHLELVDSHGTVIASNNPMSVFSCVDHNRFLEDLIKRRESAVGVCHRCHEGGKNPETPVRTTDLLAFAPLLEAPWGVSVREPQKVVFASSDELKRRFVVIGFIAIGSALILALGMSSGIVRPLKQLTSAAERIAGGDLSDPIKVKSEDELGILADTFDRMRTRLAELLEDIRDANLQLEKRVEKRTEALKRHRRRLFLLLREVMSAEENERTRIARELHDETSQVLAALGMSLDLAEMELERGTLTSRRIRAIRAKVTRTMEDVRLLIRNLRPPIIDDLGLEASVRWLLEEHLKPRDIHYVLRVTPEFRKLAAEHFQSDQSDTRSELMVFRVIQEAIVNIARHARATEVMVVMKYEDYRIQIYIEDDGVSFDVEAVLDQAEASGRGGFGIIGMKERVALLGGTLEIDRGEDGRGTLITVDIPLSSLEEQDA